MVLGEISDVVRGPRRDSKRCWSGSVIRRLRPAWNFAPPVMSELGEQSFRCVGA